VENIFTGLKVIDFTNNLAGPVSTLMLATFGAEVIKIEKPGSGDDSRGFGTKFQGESLFFMGHNRGKKSITLELKTPEAKEIIRKLVAEADVVVESFRPGVMARLGLGYEDLITINPKIVMCSISAFGQSGPYSKLAGYDIIAQGMSGFMDVTGNADGPPLKIGPSIGDYTAGFNAFGAIASALYYRERSGKGQYIDTSLVDCLIAADDYAEYAFNGFPVGRTGNHHGLFAPYGVFEGTKGSVVIGILNQKLWNDFSELIGHSHMANNEKFDDPGKRRNELPEIIDAIESWLRTFPDIDEPITAMKARGIPCTKVNNLTDLLSDPHIAHRDMIVDVEVPHIPAGRIKAKGVHIKFSQTPGVIGSPPMQGQHTREILNSIGYDEEEIARLKDNGIL